MWESRVCVGVIVAAFNERTRASEPNWREGGAVRMELLDTRYSHHTLRSPAGLVFSRS